MHLKANSPAVAHHGKTLIGFNWIGGREVEGDLPSFDAKSAVDSRDTVGIFPGCGERDVEKAAKAAGAALGPWGALSVAERAQWLGRIAEVLERHDRKVAAVITREVGKTPAQALAELQEALGLCAFIQESAWRLKEQGAPAASNRLEWSSQRRPVGVCALMTAGFSPLAAPLKHLLAALLCGNTVVWKPSESTPTTAYLLVRCLMDAGLPPGVVNVVNGKGRNGCGKFLVAGLDKGFYRQFSFIGSDQACRDLGALAGSAQVATHLEPVRKNAMIIMPDCDLDQAVQAAVAGAFTDTGQGQTALGNLILHRDAAAPFKEKFLQAVAALTVGNPISDPEVTCGPLANARVAKRFEEHWSEGREQGATLLCGGERYSEVNRTSQIKGFIAKGAYMQPCVWDGVDPGMRLFQASVFGPSVNLCTVAGFEEALAAANALPDPLTGSLFTQSPEWIRRFRAESNAAVACVNAWADSAEAHRAFGGMDCNNQGAIDALVRVRTMGEPGFGSAHQTLYEPTHWDHL